MTSPCSGRVHFIGVCGTAMATLAAMLKQRGYDVQGSDHGVYPPMSGFLAREGIRVFDGQGNQLRYGTDYLWHDLDPPPGGAVSGVREFVPEPATGAAGVLCVVLIGRTRGNRRR